MAKRKQAPKLIGKYNERFNIILGIDLPILCIYQSDGLFTHVRKHHEDDLRYYDKIALIVDDPDYIGTDPTKPGSIELIKKLDEHVLAAITLDKKETHYYVSTMFSQTSAKVQARLSSGRYKRV